MVTCETSGLPPTLRSQDSSGRAWPSTSAAARLNRRRSVTSTSPTLSSGAFFFIQGPPFSGRLIPGLTSPNSRPNFRAAGVYGILTGGVNGLTELLLTGVCHLRDSRRREQGVAGGLE